MIKEKGGDAFLSRGSERGGRARWLSGTSRYSMAGLSSGFVVLSSMRR